MTRALRARQLVHLGSDDRGGAGERTGPCPRIEVGLEAWMPRVHEQQQPYGSFDRPGEIRVREAVELARRRTPATRISVSGEIDQVERRERAARHPVEIGEPRLARRGAGARN